MQLTPTQARVAGALAEKQLTTPQQYPLTLNALVAACNQTSNREPVMRLSDQQVVDAIEALREKGLARIVHPSHGSRSTRYRQVMEERLGLSQEELALLTVLLLRGSQTTGELRQRTDRMAAFDSLQEVEERLRALAGRDQPLVVLLERRPGQKEPRWADLLQPDGERGSQEAPPAAAAAAPRGHGAWRRPERPRLGPVGDEELDEQGRELLERVDERVRGAGIFRTLVRHPRLFRRWLPFGGVLLDGRLPPRDRELLILRTAWRCQADYEWSQHVRLAREAGLSDDEISRATLDAGAPGWEAWSGWDRTLLQAVDQLHEAACLSDGLWDALARRYDDAQLLEVPMVVGHYTLLAYTLNSLGVPRDPGTPPLPGRMGA